MILRTTETINRAGHLAAMLASCKALGLTDRNLLNDLLRGVLVANPGLLGVWSVWEPDALDGCDSRHAGKPGHDGSGRFVPFWHRHGGGIQLEPNTDYDKPGSDWYFGPARRGGEVVTDPYEYRVGGEKLFITSQAAPVYHGGKCVGVAGFDVHMDSLLEAAGEPDIFEPLEAALGRGHVLLDENGCVRYCSNTTRKLICRYVGKSPGRHLPVTLHEIVLKKLERGYFSSPKAQNEWTFSHGVRRLVVRFTKHPHAGCFLLLVEERMDDGCRLQPGAELSPREREVAEWMGQGKSNDEIAIILGISAHTVKNHLGKIFGKFGVENRHAATLALQRRTGVSTRA